MELPAFAPDPTPNLITTDANKVASCQLHMLLLEALEGDAASRFDDRPQFKDKGFKMVMVMREAHAPTGELALLNNFCSLTDLEMKTGEALETYMCRVRNAVNQLRGGNMNLHPILVTLFAVRGLDSAYEAVKHDLAVHSENYTDLTLDNLERRCLTFVNATQKLQSDAAIPTAAAAEVANNSTRSRDPGTLSTPNNSKDNYLPQLRHSDIELITA